MTEIQSFFIKHCKPKYKVEDIVECEKISLGYSNETYRIKTKNNKQYQVRFGMNNDIIFRDNERAILKLINDQTYVYYDLKTGNSIRHWFVGRNPVVTDIDIQFLKKLVDIIEQLHKTDLNHPAAKKVRKHNNLCFEQYVDERLASEHWQKYLELTHTYKDLPKCLSHNDISLLNLIYNDQTQELELIDYEWGRINNYYWDYANFIREARLDLELAQWLAKLAKLEWEILADHIFLTTCFAVQWALSMPYDPGIEAYMHRTNELLSFYYQKFYNVKKPRKKRV
ncbi:thiamine kinase-like enzyme [Mycoplasmoides fastidiosum]|uniref:Thiamine kinase-like enzyme n=1 Tax=Mycoplasmoides fastidiosum TaxID=92758 RepID=A0ABU0LYY7_9BACT|nr:phosphotransferase [Mycoplasmoides fastidiosum]MDQ0513921.1 thiamine kinase-like enzyme [Mycoplasmoides fastidiosum]UUD37665.1 phosphotransferase [Mycoplasmoides fastidiosum]